MKIYCYDINGYYTGMNYEFNGKILPKFTTKVVPPTLPDHQHKAKYIVGGNRWDIVSITDTPTPICSQDIVATISTIDLDEPDLIDVEAHKEEYRKFREEIQEQVDILKKEINVLKKQFATINTKMLIKI